MELLTRVYMLMMLQHHYSCHLSKMVSALDQLHVKLLTQYSLP